MRYVVYTSRAVIPPHGPAAAGLIAGAAEKNARLGLTGFLHREEDTFIQYIEGERGPLESVFAQIAEDDRHVRVHVLARGRITHRKFSGWEMGFSDESRRSLAIFLRRHAGKSMNGMTAGEAVLFLRGVGQNIDLGLRG